MNHMDRQTVIPNFAFRIIFRHTILRVRLNSHEKNPVPPFVPGIAGMPDRHALPVHPFGDAAGKGDGNIEEVLRRYKAYATGERFLSLEPHLKVFSGLEELEGGAKTNMDDNVYPTNRDAFNAASDALKEVLKKI